MGQPTIVIEIKGASVKSIDEICQITDKSEPLDVILSALRVYSWVLAKQANGAVIVAEYPDGSSIKFEPKEKEEELVDYVKDKNKALEFFQHRGLF